MESRSIRVDDSIDVLTSSSVTLQLMERRGKPE